MWSNRIFAGGRKPTPDYAGSAYCYTGQDLQNAVADVKRGRVSEVIIAGKCYTGGPLRLDKMNRDIIVRSVGAGEIVCPSTQHPVFIAGLESSQVLQVPTLKLLGLRVRGARFEGGSVVTGDGGHFAGVLIEQSDFGAYVYVGERCRLYCGNLFDTSSSISRSTVSDNVIYSTGNVRGSLTGTIISKNHFIGGGIVLDGGSDNLIEGNSVFGDVDTSGAGGGSRVLGNSIGGTYTAHASDTAANNT